MGDRGRILFSGWRKHHLPGVRKEEDDGGDWSRMNVYWYRAHVKEPKFVVCVFVMCYNTCFSFRERCMDAANAAFIWLFVMYVCVIMLNMFFFFPIVRTKKIHLFHIFVMVLFQKTTFLLHSCYCNSAKRERCSLLNICIKSLLSIHQDYILASQSGSALKRQKMLKMQSCRLSASYVVVHISYNHRNHIE